MSRLYHFRSKESFFLENVGFLLGAMIERGK
jgi:hypothetical protein